MYLYDAVTPPLLDGSYRIKAQTNVTFSGDTNPQDLPEKDAYFNIEGPRFRIAPNEVGGVFPPRNGHGSFSESVPHIALYRRTLPWERKLDSQGLIPTPKRTNGDPAPNPIPGSAGFLPAPWMALLVFEEGEYTLYQNLPLDQVVPSDTFARMGSPPNITCDAVEADPFLVASIIPSYDELSLLAHARQVNVNDRELSAGSSDGWFSVVMSNRLPSPNAKCRACLVSLEERVDLVPPDPPPTFQPILEGGIRVPRGIDAALDRPVATTAKNAAAAVAGKLATTIGPGGIGPGGIAIFLQPVRMVLLFSWQFECIGPGTFEDLMQCLNVSMFGVPQDQGHPAITDTGHLRLKVQDRAGVEETVWYRGPLVPFQLTRDSLGPYHSADQCRRATPETGAEDVSYAAAFEVGRLLAAADPRLAQELMRWRREAFKQSLRADSFGLIQTAMSLAPIDVHVPVVPIVASASINSAVKGIGPVADPYRLDPASRMVGLDPQALQQAWNLSSVNEATGILGGDPGATGASVTAPAQTSRADTTIDAVASDTASLNRLGQMRNQILANTKQKVGSA
jgi:hypothetical protein